MKPFIHWTLWLTKKGGNESRDKEFISLKILSFLDLILSNQLIIVGRTFKCRSISLQVLEVEALERSVELEGRLIEVVVRHRRAGVEAHVKRL